jgi:hypothetical protein
MGHKPGVLGACAAASPDGPASPPLPLGERRTPPSMGGRNFTTAATHPHPGAGRGGRAR